MNRNHYSQTPQPAQIRTFTSFPSFRPSQKPHYPPHQVLHLLRAGHHFVLIQPWGQTDGDGKQLKSPIWRGWQNRRPGFTSIKKHVDKHGLLGLILYHSNLAALDVDQGDPTAMATDFPPALVLPSLQPGRWHFIYRNATGYQAPRRWTWDGTTYASGEAVSGPAQYVVLWHDALQQLADHVRYSADNPVQTADFHDVAQALTWLDHLGRPVTANDDAFTRPAPQDIPDLTQAMPGSRDFALYTYCLRWAYAHHQEYDDYADLLADLQEVSIQGRLQMPDLGPGGRDGQAFTETDALNKAKSAAGRVWQRKRQAQDSQDYPPPQNSRISSLSAPDFPKSRPKPPPTTDSGRWYELGYRGNPALNSDSEEQRRRRARRTELDADAIQRRRQHAALLYAVGNDTATVATMTRPTAVRTDVDHASLRTAQRDRAAIGKLPSRRKARRTLQSYAAQRLRAGNSQGTQDDSGRTRQGSPDSQKKGEIRQKDAGSFTTSGASPPPTLAGKGAASSPPRVEGLTALPNLRPARDGPPWPEDDPSGPVQAWVCRACGHPAADLTEVQEHLDSLPLPQRQHHQGWDIIFLPADNGEDAMPPRGFNSASTRRRGYPDVVMRSSLINHQGWTPALVKRHLGEPDEMGVNPTGRHRPDVALYHVARVKQVLEANDRLRSQTERNLLDRDLQALQNPQVDPEPLYEDRNRPRVHRIAFCARCNAWDPDAQPGDPCDIADKPGCPRYTSRLAMLCPLTPCAEDQLAVFVHSGQRAADVWRQHLEEDHSP